MDRQVIDQKLESLRRCLSRIQSKQPFDADQLANELKKSVGFRNIAVHNYSAINWQVVHAITASHLRDFDQFARSVTQWQSSQS
jgi:uncharacterized protein YutE (UPF0331/DUF86 family)